MRVIKLTIAYDGTNYHGFQRQKNAVSIQQTLEESLAPLFGHPLKIVGAGRTDAGVHALGQVAHFSTTGQIPVERISRAAAGVLPPDIVIRRAEIVEPDFHARKSAKGKTYFYRLFPGEVANPFWRNYVWHIRQPLEQKAMEEGLSYLIGTHDFSSFKAAGGAAMNPIRTLYAAECRESSSGILTLSFTGNGFLYHMVRNIVGTVVDVGLGKIPPVDIKTIVEAKNRKIAGITAPPQGLYLQQVYY